MPPVLRLGYRLPAGRCSRAVSPLCPGDKQGADSTLDRSFYLATALDPSPLGVRKMLLNSARGFVSVLSSSRAKKPLTLAISTELSPTSSTTGRLSRTAGPTAWMTIKPANVTVVSAMITFRLITLGWRIVESPLVICFTSPHCVVLMLMFNLSSHGLCSGFLSCFCPR
jgi:hypothetical protein